MSRPRSRSPHYRRFPWEEPDFDPRKVIAELDGNPRDRGHRFREPPEDFRDPYREELYLEDPRRSPFLDEPPHFRHDDEFYHWGAPPRHDEAHFANRRFPPRDGVGLDPCRHRGEFQRMDDRGAGPPPLIEGLTSASRGHSDPHQRRGAMGRDQGRFRGFIPGMRSGEDQHPNRGRAPHYDRGPAFKRERRETVAGEHPGFREEEERGFSVDRPRGGLRGRGRGIFPSGDSRLHVGKHDAVDGGRNALPLNYDPNPVRQRSQSSQERFRRAARFQDDPRDSHNQEVRRSPNTERYGNPGGPASYRGRGRYNQGPRGRAGPHRSQPPHQDVAQGEQRHAYPPFRDDYANITEPSWEDEEQRAQRWRSLEPNAPRNKPRREWSEPLGSDDVTVITEETLTIKVDMSRPTQRNSPLCYSSDRQLSLDLVNVGRQRLDFLPLLEHSGTYRETATNSGTFAQEIITLVHFVKEQYFRGEGVTLNERFSAPQTGGYAEDGSEELTLNQRFSSNRGFSLNLNSLLDEEDDEPLFFRLGSMQDVSKQPLRGPGDLRHDLERRRQEKLEAVKVTIAGSGLSRRSHGEPDLTPPMDDDSFSSWPGEQNRRQEGSTGSRRGAYSRPIVGPQRRNHQFGNQRQNLHSGATGPNW